MAKDISDLETHVGYWMRFVSNHVSHSFSLRLEAEGVTVAEWVVLRELLRLGECAPSKLAEALGLTRGAISKLVERLVEKELASRTTEAEDRRFQRVALTRAGRSLVPRLAALADENDAAFFGHLSSKKRRELIALLQEIARRGEFREIPLK